MPALLLDLYDTLVWCDWPRFHREWAARAGTKVEAFEQALRLTSRDRNTGRLDLPEVGVEALLRASGREPSPDLVSRLVAFETDFLAERVVLHEDVTEAVRRLREDGWTTILVSNCSYNTPAIVERLGLPELMDEMVLSCEVGAVKPDPEIFEIALRAAGASAGSAVFVDDDPAYLDGAAAAGIRTVRIARTVGFPASRDSRAHPVIVDLLELEDLLARWGLTPPPAGAG